ncbi:organic hydroperoxide reductase OsmC/OhrA [Arthrobacter sp. V4I6]|uniref:OsmC family protein n=1 Tax=unclassified Arthrobacter TaxID=235627 RepID=UPI0027840E22|nr:MULTISPECIES: OsmC family protein [unclassified Arthrobacter]MDQ0820626.1 organic hydroperoxide reductase OsmC/OhrA [Arthrobacter sp. V1I7]MDQ0854883.1 organic hydroperoxide reductase OsmC/OhrA [Arthrobacter sp. V4I6]
MSLDEHRYALTVRWTGNLGRGTASYRGYSRDHDIEIPGLPVLRGSADPSFHGDRTRCNPEQLLLAALSQCHMLSFLHVAVKHGVVVSAYEDHAEGLMRTNRDGSGQFESVTLKPRVTVAAPAAGELPGAGQPAAGLLGELHAEANKLCFIARSVNFPVLHEPSVVVQHPGD